MERQKIAGRDTRTRPWAQIANYDMKHFLFYNVVDSYVQMRKSSKQSASMPLRKVVILEKDPKEISVTLTSRVTFMLINRQGVPYFIPNYTTCTMYELQLDIILNGGIYALVCFEYFHLTGDRFCLIIEVRSTSLPEFLFLKSILIQLQELSKFVLSLYFHFIVLNVQKEYIIFLSDFNISPTLRLMWLIFQVI